MFLVKLVNSGEQSAIHTPCDKKSQYIKSFRIFVEACFTVCPQWLFFFVHADNINLENFFSTRLEIWNVICTVYFTTRLTLCMPTHMRRDHEILFKRAEKVKEKPSKDLQHNL